MAMVTPLPRRRLNVHELIARRQRLPRVDAARLREDVDAIVDQSL